MNKFFLGLALVVTMFIGSEAYAGCHGNSFVRQRVVVRGNNVVEFVEVPNVQFINNGYGFAQEQIILRNRVNNVQRVIVRQNNVNNVQRIRRVKKVVNRGGLLNRLLNRNVQRQVVEEIVVGH